MDLKMNNLPHNYEAEQGLLGMLLEDNRKYDVVSSIINEDSFSTPEHSQIYKAIAGEVEAGKSCDAVTLSHRFEGNDGLKAVGGADYLKQIQAEFSPMASAKDYAKLISVSKTKRTFLLSMNGMSDIIRDAENNVDPQDLINELESELFTAIKDSNEGQSIAQALEGTFKWIHDAREGKQVVYKTGLNALDDTIGGLRPNGLYIIGARPGMGKTALALNIAEQISARKAVKFFSLEMPANELCMRLLAGRTNISMQDQMEGNLKDADLELLYRANSKLATLPFHVDDRAGVDINYIVSESRRFARKNEGCAIFIDYLGLIRGDRRIQNKVHQIEEITTRLKALAKEINAPVVLLSQLSRSLEGREDKRPTMSDLRDSGSIEQDADVIMFIYRDEFYLERDWPKRNKGEGMEMFMKRTTEHESLINDQKGKAQILISKNRQGTSGTANVMFNGQRQRFYNE